MSIMSTINSKHLRLRLVHFVCAGHEGQQGACIWILTVVLGLLEPLCSV